MAIVPTGAIFKTLTFGSVNSGTYGIYITGEAVYNAPERAVERVSVPGRNGAILIDQGRFENVQVSYPASIGTGSQADFRDAIRDFRNAILSQLGYQRLTDGYNPNEYRMANASAGVEVSPAAGGKAGEFELVFDCMPQRFLTSGETEQTIAASGDTITNPTLFESQPVIKADGYGKISFNGYEMEIFNVPIGPVQISGVDSVVTSIYDAEDVSMVKSYNKASFANGDTITVSKAEFWWGIGAEDGNNNVNISGNAGTGVAGVTTQKVNSASGYYLRKWIFPDISLTVGTSQTITHTATPQLWVGDTAQTITLTMTITHDAAAGTITFTLQNPLTIAGWNASYPDKIDTQNGAVQESSIFGNSTKSSIADPIYIDTEIGEAYIIQGGEPVSVNNSVSIGADLPVLAPGANAVTFDNTFNSVKITPRWWQL